jgi:uncharacterized membrane protein YgcG
MAMDAAAVQALVQKMLSAAQAAQPAAPAAPAASRIAGPAAPRLPPPVTFEGRAAALDEWLADIQQQITWYGMGEADAIRFAGAFMRGAARDWLLGLAAVPATWVQLVAELRTRFQPVNSADTARGKLLTLTQGKQSVHEYVDAFRRLLIRVPSMSNDDRLFQFIRGLRPAIGLQLRVHGVATLDDAIAMAARIGGISDSVQHVHAQGGSAASSSAPMELDMLAGIEGLEADTSSATDAPITRAELQLLLNAIREGHRGTGASSSSSSSNRQGGDRAGGNRGAQGASGGFQGPRGLPRIKGFSPEKVQQYMDANKCFGCHNVGHRSSECPLRKVDSNGRATWSN